MRHFLFNMIFLKDNKVQISKYKIIRKQKRFWVIKISFLAFLLSLLLSLFSEVILNKTNLLIAILLLFVFMILNILSDMLGLAITSCQTEILKTQKIDRKVYLRCMSLIRNSDKVSSILCDVVGDICGILCGVSGTMIAYVISKCIILGGIGFFLGAIISALIAGFTVLFKAIAKNYAVKNSTRIVIKIAEILNILYKTKEKKDSEKR